MIFLNGFTRNDTNSILAVIIQLHTIIHDFKNWWQAKETQNQQCLEPDAVNPNSQLRPPTAFLGNCRIHLGESARYCVMLSFNIFKSGAPLVHVSTRNRLSGNKQVQ